MRACKEQIAYRILGAYALLFYPVTEIELDKDVNSKNLDLMPQIVKAEGNDTKLKTLTTKISKCESKMQKDSPTSMKEFYHLRMNQNEEKGNEAKKTNRLMMLDDEAEGSLDNTVLEILNGQKNSLHTKSET